MALFSTLGSPSSSALSKYSSGLVGQELSKGTGQSEERVILHLQRGFQDLGRVERSTEC